MRLTSRLHNFAEIARQTYRPDQSAIRVGFVEDGRLNASVSRTDTYYRVSIAASAPALLLTLSNRILAGPDVCPFLPPPERAADAESVDFVCDPHRLTTQTAWQVDLAGPRIGFARRMGDIMAVFIGLHELGHLLSGHVDALQQDSDDIGFDEMTAPGPDAGERLRRLIWEYEADLVAASFMSNYVDTFLTLSPFEGRASLRTEANDPYHEAVAFFVSSLYVLFVYMRGPRHAIDAAAFHPHPMTRALYIRDALCQAIKNRRDFSTEAFQSVSDQRLDEVIDRLEELGVTDGAGSARVYTPDHDAQRHELHHTAIAMRPQWAAHSWITWDR